MKKVKFLFGIHCHQPVGNFEHVFEEAYEKAYSPFIKTMEKHPKIKFAVHYSGILYDWFAKNRPQFMEELKKLVKRGQVEILTAGYYEPIIPIIPDEDKIGQIEMSNRFISEKFGVSPRGMWLTERIWEPTLPKPLASFGIEYVTVDDYHFISAGLSSDKLFGYYITEENGFILKVFPINKTLRYFVPFKLPEETIKYLQSIASESAVAAILFDDGEKFGIWPGTHKWVYEDGYLESLLTELEKNSDWIEFMSFSQFVDEYPPLGRIYLPAASYFEMMEWSLLPQAGKKLEKIVEELKREGRFEEYSQFFKGGFFRNFFVKYPEANNMHKKMLYISQKLQTAKGGKTLFGRGHIEDRLKNATLELYRGQCSCAYWHGVFGGLYLNYLRHAVYEHLIKAEVEIEKFSRGKSDYVDLTITDFNKDGKDEVILSNSMLNLYLAPSYGGALFELDYKPKAFNLINSLARREEVYHLKIKEAAKRKAQELATIHGAPSLKEEGLEKALVYDWHQRCCLLDHFLAPDTDLEGFSQVAYHESGDFTIEPYSFMPKRAGSEVSMVLTRNGMVDKIPVRVEKEISLFSKQSLVGVEYRITNFSEEKEQFWFGVEFNFSMLAADSKERYYQIGGMALEDNSMKSKGQLEKVKAIKIVDEWKGFGVLLEMDEEATLWRFPIETVSQSEAGLEKTYQSSVLFPNWKFSLGPNEVWKVKILLRVEE